MEYFYNAIRTPDGTVLESHYRHDYKKYTDANGCEYIVDGGLDYLRRGWTPNAPPCEELAVMNDGDYLKGADYLKWGTYGEYGEDELKRVTLSSMSTGHLLNILDDYAEGRLTVNKHYIAAMQAVVDSRTQEEE